MVGKYLLIDKARAPLKARQAKLATRNCFYDFYISVMYAWYFCLLSMKKLSEWMWNRERGPRMALLRRLLMDILGSGTGVDGCSY